METKLVYCDETGDDGCNVSSSDTFILTSMYMPATSWHENFNQFKEFRKTLKEDYGFHTAQEMHTKHFLTDKNPYRDYGWSNEEKISILQEYTLKIALLDIRVINVIINKRRIARTDYNILQNALTYNIQRIENDSSGNWNYIIITDKGRIAPMKKTARAIRAFNPIPSQFGSGYSNKPIRYLIEDIIEKDSVESYFIQICDFISYFVHLYYKTQYLGEPLPSRVGKLIDTNFVKRVMKTFKNYGILNEKASSENYGLVIYPKQKAT